MISSTTSRKAVTLSWSRQVKTVSRCIAARDFGMAQAMTRSAAPFSNSRSATWFTAWRVVRSPMPISTTPLPIGMTSPPSIEVLPQSSSLSPHQISNSFLVKAGWNL